MPTAFIGLGSNLGRRETFLRQALRTLGERMGTLVRCSSFYQTAPWGFASDRLFLNAAASFETALSPLEILALTQEVERFLGRKAKTANGQYEDRTIDIDLLLYDDLIFTHKALTIPHPALAQRRFVLEPLAEIAPAFIHPVYRKTIAELLACLVSA